MKSSFVFDPPLLARFAGAATRMVSRLEMGQVDSGEFYVGLDLDVIPEYKKELTGYLFQKTPDGYDYPDQEYPEEDFDWSPGEWTERDSLLSDLGESFGFVQLFDDESEALLYVTQLKVVYFEAPGKPTALSFHASRNFVFDSGSFRIEFFNFNNAEVHASLSNWPSMKMPAEYYVELYLARKRNAIKATHDEYSQTISAQVADAKKLASNWSDWHDLTEDYRKARDGRNFWERGFEDSIGDGFHDQFDDEFDNDESGSSEVLTRASNIEYGAGVELKALGKTDVDHFAGSLETIWEKFRVHVEYKDTHDGERNYIYSESLELLDRFLVCGNLTYRWIDDAWVKCFATLFYQQPTFERGIVYHIASSERAETFMKQHFG